MTDKRLTYKGNCHCGEVQFEFESEPITEGVRCNCSICKRLGIVHSQKIDPPQFRIKKGQDKIKIYLWNDCVVPFTYCNNCGIYLFYDGEPHCRVNLGCVDNVDTFSLNKIHFFDGKNEL